MQSNRGWLVHEQHRCPSYFASHQGSLQALVELMSVIVSSRRTKVGLVELWKGLNRPHEQHKKCHRSAMEKTCRGLYGILCSSASAPDYRMKYILNNQLFWIFRDYALQLTMHACIYNHAIKKKSRSDACTIKESINYIIRDN